MVAKLAEHLDVRLNHEVTEIQYSRATEASDSGHR